MKLFQIPFSHNCIKVRHVLDLKGVPYETVNISPVPRAEVKRASGQVLVPALVDGERAVSGSTDILLYLEERHPEPSLLPSDPEARAECLVLMDWADATFMALTRRLAYFQVLSGPPEDLGSLFFPQADVRRQKLAGAAAGVALRMRFKISAKRNRADVAAAKRGAALAVERLAGHDHLVGDSLTLADITLASMTSPLQYTASEVRDDPAVKGLLAWSARIMGGDFDPVGRMPAAAAA